MWPSQEPASRALARMHNSDLCIDPRHLNHIQAYNALRGTQIRRITCASLRAFLTSQDASVVQTAKVDTTYWLVPKALLPTPVGNIASAIVSADDLLHQGVPAGKVDFETYWIVDKIIPRESLPKSTTEITLSLGAVNKYKPPTLDGGSAPEAGRAATGAQTQAATHAPPPAARGNRKSAV